MFKIITYFFQLDSCFNFTYSKTKISLQNSFFMHLNTIYDIELVKSELSVFSTLVAIRTKPPNRLNIKDDTRIALFNTVPNFKAIIQSKQ